MSSEPWLLRNSLPILYLITSVYSRLVSREFLENHSHNLHILSFEIIAAMIIANIHIILKMPETLFYFYALSDLARLLFFHLHFTDEGTEARETCLLPKVKD